MNKDNSEQKTINLRMTVNEWEKLVRLADSQRRSMNSTAVLAILEKWERDMEKK